jgi:hypothetical protein
MDHESFQESRNNYYAMRGFDMLPLAIVFLSLYLSYYDFIMETTRCLSRS